MRCRDTNDRSTLVNYQPVDSNANQSIFLWRYLRGELNAYLWIPDRRQGLLWLLREYLWFYAKTLRRTPQILSGVPQPCKKKDFTSKPDKSGTFPVEWKYWKTWLHAVSKSRKRSLWKDVRQRSWFHHGQRSRLTLFELVKHNLVISNLIAVLAPVLTIKIFYRHINPSGQFNTV